VPRSLSAALLLLVCLVLLAGPASAPAAAQSGSEAPPRTCPTPTGECPQGTTPDDSDADGVQDAADACPEEGPTGPRYAVKTVAADGCPPVWIVGGLMPGREIGIKWLLGDEDTQWQCWLGQSGGTPCTVRMKAVLDSASVRRLNLRKAKLAEVTVTLSKSALGGTMFYKNVGWDLPRATARALKRAKKITVKITGSWSQGDDGGPLPVRVCDLTQSENSGCRWTVAPGYEPIPGYHIESTESGRERKPPSNDGDW
jgi:hypothetical protein